MLRFALISFLFYCNLFAIGGYRTSVVRSESGFIDYANRVIVCRGTADIEEKKTGDGSLDVIGVNLKLSKAEARARARENLVDLIKQVNFDGRTVNELMISDRLIESRIESLVSSAFQQGEIEYLEESQIAIALAIKMSGLAEILVDSDGYLKENLSQPAYLKTRSAVPKSQRVSGIVIDARNVYHIPAMVPKIFNEDYNLVYGPRHYTRSRSVNRGPIGYAHSMDDRNVIRRVGKNPMMIEVKTSSDDINLMVSNTDADRIRDADKKFGLLSDCKVLVLLQ
ncbi:MAG: hypothetical protein CMG74_05385 [Candidatus Marinimicrobia bacterium]|nr:hypothetical protein [Candidatus Neomarinimicrobiota bacterium]